MLVLGLVILGGPSLAVAPPSNCNEIFVELNNARKDGQEYDEVSQIVANLPIFMKDDSKCHRFFGGKEKIADWTFRLLDYKLLAVAKTTSVANPTGTIISGFTSSCGARIPAGYAAIFIATNGSFFNLQARTVSLIDGRWKYYRGASIRAKVILILHELAHSMELGYFDHNDRGDARRSAMNNGIVLSECMLTIESAGRKSR